jgi:hypothetical protein
MTRRTGTEKGTGLRANYLASLRSSSIGKADALKWHAGGNSREGSDHLECGAKHRFRTR